MKNQIILLLVVFISALFAAPEAAKSDCLSCQVAITAPASPSYSLIPDTDNAYDLGSGTNEWKDLYIDGRAHMDEAENTVEFKGTGNIFNVTSSTDNIRIDIEDDDQEWFLGMASSNNDFALRDNTNSALVFNVTDSANPDFDFGTTVEVGVQDNLAVGATAQTDGEKLYVKAGDDGVTVGSSGAANLILEDSGTNYMAFRTPTDTDGGFVFNGGAGATTAVDGGILYRNNDTTPFFYVYVGGASQIRFYDGDIRPSSDNDIDLGTSSREYKDAYIDGTAYVDTLEVHVGLTSTATGDLGWTIQSGANTACTTTCTSAAVFGFDTGTNVMVGPSDATADTCICAGAS